MPDMLCQTWLPQSISVYISISVPCLHIYSHRVSSLHICLWLPQVCTYVCESLYTWESQVVCQRSWLTEAADRGSQVVCQRSWLPLSASHCLSISHCLSQVQPGGFAGAAGVMHERMVTAICPEVHIYPGMRNLRIRLPSLSYTRSYKGLDSGYPYGHARMRMGKHLTLRLLFSVPR